MRNNIIIEIGGVYLSDFDNKLPSPVLIEDMDGGVRVLFNDISELNHYQDSLFEGDQSEGLAEAADDQRKEVKEKINKELNKALSDNKAVLDAIRAYAKALFSFIFKGEGHRQDKLFIVDAILTGIQDSANSLELGASIKEATYELGTLVLDHRLTFYNYAHNDVDYDFDKIKAQLTRELNELKTSLGN